MSKSIFKKTAAIVCSAATLVALSATAMLAGAQTTLTKDERASEIAANGPTLMADKVIAEPGEKVKYGMYIANNPGFSACGGYLVYDSHLVPYVYENDDAMEGTPWKESMGIDVLPEFIAGTAETPTSGAYGRSNPLTVVPSCNGTVNRFAFGTIGGAVNKAPEGQMFYMFFQVPEDAKPGTEYPIELTINQWLDADADAVEFTKVDGWIRVAGETTTSSTTTETTTSETTTSETTTSETTTSETTTSETTTSETTTSETTTSETTTSETTTSETTTSETTTSETTTSETTTSETTTSETTTSETTTSETTTSETTTGDSTTGSTDSTTSSTTTTPAKGGNTPAGTQAPGAKTGDAGVGAAVAGLLLAAGAAVAVASKKKED